MTSNLMSGSDSDISSKIIIAKWTDRFLAWLIDFVIISIISTSVIFASLGTLDYEYDEDVFWAESTQYIPTSILFFAYWTILEYKTGQTIGKKILNLKVTDIYGNTSQCTMTMVHRTLTSAHLGSHMWVTVRSVSTHDLIVVLRCV